MLQFNLFLELYMHDRIVHVFNCKNINLKFKIRCQVSVIVVFVFVFRNQRLLKLANNSSDLYERRVYWRMWHYAWDAQERRLNWRTQKDWNSVAIVGRTSERKLILSCYFPLFFLNLLMLYVITKVSAYTFIFK